MHRPTLGAITLLLFAVAIYCRVFQPEAGAAAIGPALRVGLVLAALWFAHPQLQRMPRWMVITLVVSLFVVSWKPKVLLVALPVLALLLLLRPRRPRKMVLNEARSKTK
jgi:hypothetical protein